MVDTSIDDDGDDIILDSTSNSEKEMSDLQHTASTSQYESSQSSSFTKTSYEEECTNTVTLSMIQTMVMGKLNEMDTKSDIIIQTLNDMRSQSTSQPEIKKSTFKAKNTDPKVQRLEEIDTSDSKLYAMSDC